MKMEVTFKSGATVTVDVTDMSLEKANLTKQLSKIVWTNLPEKTARSLMYLDLDSIDALVIIEEDGM